MANPPDENDLASDIVGVDSYDAPAPAKLKYEPWHLPRKQLVRQDQWVTQLNRMLDDMGVTERELRYLGLPGADLLDLRHFHSAVCEPRKMTLRFLGFNSGVGGSSPSQTEFNVSLAEVRQLGGIHPLSEVIADRFELISNAASMAWKKTLEVGPYDVVNLDLCDGFLMDPPAPLSNTLYRAVNRLMALQARRKEPWLLLLTTRVGSEHVNADVWELLLDLYVNNLKCPEFVSLSEEKLSIKDEATLRNFASTAKGSAVIIQAGLCKWLIGQGLDQRPPTTSELKSVLEYQVRSDAECPDLVSFAILFSPTVVPIPDQLGLAGAEINVDECVGAIAALKRIVKRKDVDQLLRENTKLNETMLKDSEVLLNQARYDVARYRGWVGEKLREIGSGIKESPKSIF